MKTIYLVHCWDGTKDDGWYPWLEEQISDENTKVVRWDMPNTDTPTIEEWVKELENHVETLDENTYFVGHSIGCQTILRYLEKNNVTKVGGILLVAPWLDLLPEAVSDEESYNTAYPWINTAIDFDKIKNITSKKVCIFSDNDYFVSLNQEKEFRRLLDAKTIIVKEKGHISEDDDVYELTEILDTLKEMLK